jgi:fatty-acid desaturase
MMKPVLRVDGSNASATDGWPVLDWPKACWNGFMLAVATIGCPLLFSWSAVGLFMAATYASLLVGHSVGMHRMMIHHSFQCSKPVERLLIYAGVLVGVAGPYGIIRIHDTRDWAQRQASCHDFFAHRRSLARDLLWQLAYKFRFDRPPMLKIEPNLADDPWCRFMDRTWRLHQLLPGVVFYAIGGWSWIVWGVCLRVFVSAAGHWTVTYYCHNPGPGRWRVKGAAVQASNIPGLGLITYGECWHNNHHAFPESARIGLEPGQTDPGWLFIRLLRGLGLIRNVGVPRGEGSREDLALASGPAA